MVMVVASSEHLRPTRREGRMVGGIDHEDDALDAPLV